MNAATTLIEPHRDEHIVFRPVARVETLQHKTVVVVTTSAMVIAVLLLLWAARTALLLMFAGIVLAVMLRAASRWIERRARLSPGWALPLLLFSFAVVVSLAVWSRGSEIGWQIDQLQQKIPAAARQLTSNLPNSAFGRWLIRHGADPQQAPRLLDIIPKVTGFLSGTVGFILGLLFVLYIGITVAAEPQTYLRGFEQLFPLEKRPRLAYVVGEVGQNLRRWIVARLASMLAVGVLATAGLYALGIPLAGTLGIFAATMTFIPNLGPVLSMVPPALLGFAGGPRQGLLVLLLFGTVHFIEGSLITPIAERTVVHLPPAFMLSAQLLLAAVCGPVGVALAAPITIVGIVLVRTLYIEDCQMDGKAMI